MSVVAARCETCVGLGYFAWPILLDGKSYMADLTCPICEGTGWERCPLDNPHGETICRDGVLWTLTYSAMGPPDSRQHWGKCNHPSHRKAIEGTKDE